MTEFPAGPQDEPGPVPPQPYAQPYGGQPYQPQPYAQPYAQPYGGQPSPPQPYAPPPAWGVASRRVVCEPGPDRGVVVGV